MNPKSADSIVEAIDVTIPQLPKRLFSKAPQSSNFAPSHAVTIERLAKQTPGETANSTNLPPDDDNAILVALKSQLIHDKPQPAPAAPFYDAISQRPFLALFLATLSVGLIWLALPELSVAIRLSFIAFTLALIGWTLTKLDDTYVALVATSILVLAGVMQPQMLFDSFGHDLIWLLVAASVVAAAVKQCGLSERLALAVARYAHSVQQLLYGLTAFITLTAFLIPSTSGRAALLLPVFLALARHLREPRIVLALALLFPTVILLSACASLIGAGAHLITADIIWRLSGQRLDFLAWLSLGLPFALVSCFASAWVIGRLFLDSAQRRLALDLSGVGTRAPLKRDELYVMATVGLMVLGWLSGGLHGIDNTLIALLGALVITMPPWGPITLKNGIKSVEWNLLLFMAATLVLGESLISTGAAEWLMKTLFGALGNSVVSSAIGFTAVVTLISLLAHLVITSRTARATVLVPLIALLASSFGYSTMAFAFVCVVATGFCQTFTASAKPVAIFSAPENQPTYSPGDLMRLSSVLLPLHFVLLMLFALLIWPLLGLPIVSQ